MAKVKKVGAFIEVSELSSNNLPDYINSKGFSFEIQGDYVQLHDELLQVSYSIAFSEFEDGSGSPLNTEEEIINYLTSL